MKVFLGTPINRTPVDEANKRTEGGVLIMDVLVKFIVEYTAAASIATCLSATPLPQPYARADVSPVRCLWSSCNTPRSPKARLFTILHCAVPAFEAILQDVSRALKLLYGENLVFGDLW